MQQLMQTLLACFAAERQRESCADLNTVLEGPRLTLRMPDVKDWQAWTKLRALSADFLKPWEPAWPADAVSRHFYMRQWRRYARRWVQDREYAFLIFRREIHGGEGGLLGGITITDIQRGVYQCGTMGYWMGAPFAGQGYMREAVRLLLPFCWQQLSLNRLEATCLPQNERSIGLLRGAGFRDIGLSRSRMQIEGVWRDQLIFEKIRP